MPSRCQPKQAANESLEISNLGLLGVLSCLELLDDLLKFLQRDTVQEETEMRHPIQSTVWESAALCQNIGTPKISSNTTSKDAQSEDALSSHARRSSTCCHNAWPCASPSAWKHNIPPSSTATKIFRHINVSWIICYCAMVAKAHCIVGRRAMVRVAPQSSATTIKSRFTRLDPTQVRKTEPQT